jgi:hypothetical protein
MCHVSRLTDDQQIAYERWSRRWQREFETRTDRLTYPAMDAKTRDVFLEIEEEMGKSGERISERIAEAVSA